MHKLLLLLAACALVGLAQPQAYADHRSRIDADRMFADLEWLAAPERQGRGAGTPGGAEARAWIRERFTEIGIAPQEHAFTFTSREGARIEGSVNVYGWLPGTETPERVIAITAHYDGLGVRNHQVHAGADDNASGTAAILEIARWFSANPPRHTLLFVAFDAEEYGLRGAEALLDSGLLDERMPVFNVNLDMISRDIKNELFAVGTTHYAWLDGLLDQIDEPHLRFRRDKDREWTGASDHAAFHRRSIPFIYFGVDDHIDYHRPTDTADRVDREFYRRAVETVMDFILILDQQGVPGQ